MVGASWDSLAGVWEGNEKATDGRVLWTFRKRRRTYRETAMLPALTAGRTARENILQRSRTVEKTKTINNRRGDSVGRGGRRERVEESS